MEQNPNIYTDEYGTWEEQGLFKTLIEPSELWLEENKPNLSLHKQNKIDQLKEICTRVIYGGFEATNGHIYGLNELDQSNFTQQSVMILSGYTGDVKWKTKDAGVVTHTIEEFQTIVSDASAHKLAQQSKYWELEKQVNEATTIEELDAIEWV